MLVSTLTSNPVKIRKTLIFKAGDRLTFASNQSAAHKSKCDDCEDNLLLTITKLLLLAILEILILSILSDITREQDAWRILAR